MILHTISCEKSQRSGPHRLRSHWKFHEPGLCQMAKITHKRTQTTLTLVQHGWNRKQKWSIMLLHRPTIQNGNTNHKPMILPLRPWGPQGNLWIPLVRSLPTQSGLEERMDWHVTTPNSPISPECNQSHVHPQDKECSLTHQKSIRSILSWKGHHRIHSLQQAKFCSSKRIPKTQ